MISIVPGRGGAWMPHEAGYEPRRVWNRSHTKGGATEIIAGPRGKKLAGAYLNLCARILYIELCF